MNTKKLTILTIIIIFSSLLMISCASGPGRFKDVTGKRVQTLLKDSKELQFDIKELHDGSWQQVTVVTPYRNPESLSLPKEVIFAVKKTGIDYSDGICVLVFLLQDGKYEVHVERRLVDFGALTKGTYNANDHVMLSASYDKWGWVKVKEVEK